MKRAAARRVPAASARKPRVGRAGYAPAGYSGTPLPQKLGFKEGTQAAVAGAPDGFKRLLGALPKGATLAAPAAAILDMGILFVTRAIDLRRAVPIWMHRLKPAGMLWIAWPKKASGAETDLTEDMVRHVGLQGGLVDVKVCAIDATWSGLKFVRRLRDR
jgi:hypothetical protein